MFWQARHAWSQCTSTSCRYPELWFNLLHHSAFPLAPYQEWRHFLKDRRCLHSSAKAALESFPSSPSSVTQKSWAKQPSPEPSIHGGETAFTEYSRANWGGKGEEGACHMPVVQQTVPTQQAWRHTRKAPPLRGQLSSSPLPTHQPICSCAFTNMPFSLFFFWFSAALNPQGTDVGDGER